jgi:hypothetical protein
VPFDAEDTLREFNEQFGKQRKQLIEQALSESVDSEVKKSQLLTKGAKAIARQKSIPVIAAMPVAVTNMLVKTPYKKFEANSKKYAETHGVGEKTAMARVARDAVGGAVGDAVVKGVPNLAKGAYKGVYKGAKGIIRGVADPVGAVRGAIEGFGKDPEEEEFLKLTEGLTEDERDFIGSFFGRTPRAESA